MNSYRFIKNILKQRKIKSQKYHPIGTWGLGILAHSMDYCKSQRTDFAIHIYTSKSTIQSLNLFYLHSWLIHNHLQNLHTEKMKN